MENNEIIRENKGNVWSYLFSPFKYIAGKESLFIGIGVLAILFILGYWTKTHFNGVLDIHYACLTKDYPISVHALYALISWGSLIIILYPMARIFSPSSVRLIDIAGTSAMARFPFILAGLWGLNSNIHLCLENVDLSDRDSIMAAFQDDIGILIYTFFITLLIMAWHIRILYNAYSVSSNLKGARGGWSFAIGLIISEIVSLLLIFRLVSDKLI